MTELHCSRLPLAVVCPASTIPAKHPITTNSPEAKLGTAIHVINAAAVLGSPLECQEVAKQYQVDGDQLELLAQLSWKVWEQLRGHFAEPKTEVLLESSGPRGTLRGRVDLLSLIYESSINCWSSDLPVEVRILDWKSGWEDSDHNEQLRGYAYLACRRWPTVKRIYAVTVRIRDQAWDAEYYMPDELSRWWMELKCQLEREPLPANPGRHCSYCPRALECPQRTEQLRQIALLLVAHDQESSRMAGYIQSVVEPGSCDINYWKNRGTMYRECLDQIRMLQEEMDRIRQAIKVDVQLHGGQLPAGAGMELRLLEQVQRKILPRQAWQVLCDELGPALLDCVDIRKTRLDQKIMDEFPRGGKRAGLQSIYRQLEDAGALSQQILERLEVKKIQQVEQTP